MIVRPAPSMLRLVCGVRAWGAVLLLLLGCQQPRAGITESEYRSLTAWLDCDECSGGERDSVRAIGGRVVPFLADALAGRGMDSRRSMFAERLGLAWSETQPPRIDSTRYVALHLENYDATLQSRSATALGDLGAYDTLRAVLERSDSVGLRWDVVAAVADALGTEPGPANGSITGVLSDPNGVGVAGVGMIVARCASAVSPRSPPSFGACRDVQGAPDTSATDAGGAFSVTGLDEGAYQVVADPATVPSGMSVAPPSMLFLLVGGTDSEQGTFTVGVSTTISGVVVNDRDLDDVVDPGEGLVDAWVRVYAGAVDRDSLVSTLVTDSTGAWTLRGLPEGSYWVEATHYKGAIPLAAMAPDQTVTNEVLVTTTAAAPIVGDTLPAAMPSWAPGASMALNVDVPHFTFIWGNGTVRGTFESGGSALSGLTVFMRRCRTAAGPAPVPGPGTCSTYFPGSPVSRLTDATGAVEFGPLQEGAYELAANPASLGLTTVVPASLLYWVRGESAVVVPLAPSTVN